MWVKLTDQFSCPGFRVVEDRKIRRATRWGGHGSGHLLQGAMNSCNPVFIDVGPAAGRGWYYKYFTQFGLKGKDGNRPAGRGSHHHAQKENMGLGGAGYHGIPPVASRSRRSSLMTTAASIVNGGNRVTPHFGVEAVSADQSSVHEFKYPGKGRILSRRPALPCGMCWNRWYQKEAVKSKTGRISNRG